MYKLGKRHQKRHAKLIIAIVITLLGSGAYLLIYFHPTSAPTIQNAAAVVKHYDGDSSHKVHFAESNFSIDLPQAWKQVAHVTNPYNQWSFQGTTGDDRSRIVAVYEDSMPLTMPVNRVLILTNENNELSHNDSVSDNCINYTSAAQQADPEAIRTKVVLDKWQGVNFYCDIGNYLRNVIGTSSAGGINTISLTGKSSGVHKFYFTFTDATISPDYTAFYNMLDSFSLK
jgi:hypothetical protein